MKTDMYRIFFKIQKKHWWFVTKKEIVLDTINKFLPKDKPIKILDIGCGSGLMLDSYEAIGTTYGMDMSDNAIKFSKEIFSGEVEKGLLPNQIPFEDSKFDLISALDVVEHVGEDEESLKSIRMRLVDGGKAIITVPAYMFLWTKFDEINEHKRRYTKNELKEKLLGAGFQIEKISYYNTLLFPLVVAVRFINKMLGRDGSSDVEMPPSMVNSILKMLFGFEKYILRICNLPFGVSIIAVVRNDSR